MDISKVWKLRDFEKKVTKTLLANDAVEFIRAEGLIPRPSGAKPGVLNPTAIPYENMNSESCEPRCSAAGLVIVSTKNQYTQLTN